MWQWLLTLTIDLTNIFQLRLQLFVKLAHEAFTIGAALGAQFPFHLEIWSLIFKNLMQELARHTTSCIFEAREVFLLPSLEVDELFLELEERRLTEPLEQTTSSEKETREVRPELGANPEPGTEPEVVDERRLQEREGRLSVRSTGTTT